MRAGDVEVDSCVDQSPVQSGVLPTVLNSNAAGGAWQQQAWFGNVPRMVTLLGSQGTVVGRELQFVAGVVQK